MRLKTFVKKFVPRNAPITVVTNKRFDYKDHVTKYDVIWEGMEWRISDHDNALFFISHPDVMPCPAEIRNRQVIEVKGPIDRCHEIMIVIK